MLSFAGSVLAASTALASAMLPVQQPVAAETAPAQVPVHVESGPELFQSTGCSHCHTLDGTGGSRGPNLSGIGRRWKNEKIRQQIEEGALEMPPYKNVLSDPQIETLVAYLHTRRAREPKQKPQLVTPTPQNPAVDPT